MARQKSWFRKRLNSRWLVWKAMRGLARVWPGAARLALTNLIFARPGAQIVEIFPGNFVKSTFWWLARRMGLDYHPVIGGPGDYDQSFWAGQQGVIHSVDRVLAAIGHR